jgi:hypothetical protein
MVILKRFKKIETPKMKASNNNKESGMRLA